MEKYDGWIVKNKWGSLLLWTMEYLKRDVIKKLGAEVWKDWKKAGCKIVKFKLLEVK